MSAVVTEQRKENSMTDEMKWKLPRTTELNKAIARLSKELDDGTDVEGWSKDQFHLLSCMVSMTPPKTIDMRAAMMYSSIPNEATRN
jgi:hypothetical protein